MARPRSFDVDVVQGAAAAVFRRLGYEAASVDELVAATGLHRGSLYGAFGSKRGLFVAVLRKVATPPEGALVAPDDDALDLLLVAALELAPRDAEVRDLVGQACQRLDPADGSPSVALGTRLLHRAGLGPALEPPPAPTPTERST